MKKSFKCIVIFLVSMMLLSMVSCGESATENATTAVTDAIGEIETKDPNYSCDLPGNLNYGDEEVNILCVNVNGRQDEFLSERLGGGVIGDAVYERNLAVETQLKIDMNFVVQSSDEEADATIRNSVQGGDGSLDIFVITTWRAFPTALTGCYLNLNNVDNLNLSKHYWSQSYNEIATFTESDRQYIATSPAALTLFRLAYLTVFNRDLCEDWKIPNIYDTVENGQWTLDYQYSLIADVWVDNDGDGKQSVDDIYGLITDTGVSMDAYCVAADIHMIRRDENGYWMYDKSVQEKLTDLTEKVSMICQAQGTYTQVAMGWGLNDIITIFGNQKAIMATTQFYSIEANISALADFNFGIAPMPKLTEAQPEYHTYVQDQLSSFGISAAVGNEDRRAMLGAVLESLAYHSYEIIRPAYYETALSLRFMQDPQSRDILDTMFDTIDFDYASTALGEVRGAMRELLPQGRGVSSRLKRLESVINKRLEADNEAAGKLED